MCARDPTRGMRVVARLAASGRRVALGPADGARGDLDKAALARLPLAAFPHLDASFHTPASRVTVASTVQEIDASVAALRAELAAGACACGADADGAPLHVLGFDTETQPKFTKGDFYHPVALVQIASPARVHLLRLSALPRPVEVSAAFFFRSERTALLHCTQLLVRPRPDAHFC